MKIITINDKVSFLAFCDNKKDPYSGYFFATTDTTKKPKALLDFGYSHYTNGAITAYTEKVLGAVAGEHDTSTEFACGFSATILHRTVDDALQYVLACIKMDEQ
jgi:hypothetical protein